MTPMTAWAEITTVAELQTVIGTPGERAAGKERPALTKIDRAWLAASPFCVLATADADGRCDASPKGDPAGRHAADQRSGATRERRTLLR